MGAFKEIMIEIMEAEEKLGRELSEIERQEIQDQYVREMNQVIDSQPEITNAELEEMCEQCGAGVLHVHGSMPTMEEIYGMAMATKEEPYFDICDSTIKDGEAVFEVAFHEDEKYDVVTIEIDFDYHVSEDEAYVDDSTIYINGNEFSQDNHPRLFKKYNKLYDQIDEQLNKWVEDNAYELWQERMQAAADFAYDCWKDDQMERGE